MSRPRQTFTQAFLDDFVVSLMFSVFGSAGFFFKIDRPLGERLLLTVLSLLVCSTAFALTLAAAQTWLLPRAKSRSFLIAVGLTALVYLGVILVALPVGISVSIAMVVRQAPWSPAIVQILSGIVNPPSVGLAFVLMACVTGVFMVSRKLGPGVLMNWMLGRYYRPRQEERVFMFLDIRDSTRLGEELGDLKFSGLIQKFFEDMSDPVLKTKGEVSHYIGDEAVLSWRMDRAFQDGNCLRFFYLMKDAVEAERARYLRDFGVVPGFKAGAHCGSVVTTQVGEIKSEIVFHGDVLNTTARTQSLCNELGCEFLVTRTLADRIGSRDGYRFVPKGEHAMKGKESEVELLAVEKA